MTLEEKKKAVSDMMLSDLTIQEWCKQNGFSTSTMYNYMKELELSNVEIPKRKKRYANTRIDYDNIYKIVCDAMKSNLSIKDWCSANGYNQSTFYSWVQRLKELGYDLSGKSNANPTKILTVRNKNENLYSHIYSIILKARTSDLSDKEWCKENDVNYEAFKEWIHDLEESGYRIPKSNSKFIVGTFHNEYEAYEKIMDYLMSDLSTHDWIVKNKVSLKRLREWIKRLQRRGYDIPEKASPEQSCNGCRYFRGLHEDREYGVYRACHYALDTGITKQEALPKEEYEELKGKLRHKCSLYDDSVSSTEQGKEIRIQTLGKIFKE